MTKNRLSSISESMLPLYAERLVAPRIGILDMAEHFEKQAQKEAFGEAAVAAMEIDDQQPPISEPETIPSRVVPLFPPNRSMPETPAPPLPPAATTSGTDTPDYISQPEGSVISHATQKTERDLLTEEARRKAEEAWNEAA